MFNYEIFKQYLKCEKIKFKIEYIETVNSTNDYAWSLIEKNIKYPAIVVTKNQTHGKGQRGNKWFSSQNKSLTFSIIIDRNKNYDELLSLKTAVAIIEGIKINTNTDCQLKWPNDIMINNKKMGGILIEKKGNVIVIGIGINVNENLIDIDSKIKNNSISLKMASNVSIQLEPLLAHILNKFESNYYNKNHKKIIEKWEKYCGHINKNIQFHKNHEIINGTFLRLKSNGHAIVDINGKNHIISGGIINI